MDNPNKNEELLKKLKDLDISENDISEILNLANNCEHHTPQAQSNTNPYKEIESKQFDTVPSPDLNNKIYGLLIGSKIDHTFYNNIYMTPFELNKPAGVKIVHKKNPPNIKEVKAENLYFEFFNARAFYKGELQRADWRLGISVKIGKAATFRILEIQEENATGFGVATGNSIKGEINISLEIKKAIFDLLINPHFKNIVTIYPFFDQHYKSSVKKETEIIFFDGINTPIHHWRSYGTAVNVNTFNQKVKEIQQKRLIASNT